MTAARLLSIQVGAPAAHGADAISSKPWRSGIFKFPVEGQVWVSALNLKGDGQEDLKNHGGPFRAVLAYSAEHYPQWRTELGRPDFPFGAFGENLTVTHLTEKTVCLGDVYAVGGVRLQVSQPRMPCWKLARRWGIKDLSARVQEKAMGGWYHRVLQEGYIEAEQEVVLIDRPYPQYTIDTLFALMSEWMEDREALAELSTLEALTDGWRDHFAKRAGEFA
jgi:MOSC domain-containing protein YiiM